MTETFILLERAGAARISFSKAWRKRGWPVGTCRRLKATLRLDPEREQRPSEGRHHLFSGESHVVFVELPDSESSAKCVDELDSFGEKPAKTPRIWNVVDCFLVGSTASPNHYAWYLATAFKLLEKAGVGVARRRLRTGGEAQRTLQLRLERGGHTQGLDWSPSSVFSPGLSGETSMLGSCKAARIAAPP